VTLLLGINIGTGDRYWIEQKESVEKEKEAKVFLRSFSFSAKNRIKVLLRAMWNLPACKNFLKRPGCS
jgi:hypothetical protein